MRGKGAKAGSIALTLVLIAGLAASTQAAESAASLSARGGKAGSSLHLNGREVHTTPGTISRQRLIPMTGSRALVATWNETIGGQTTSYFAISRDGARFDQVTATRNMLRLVYAQFDPLQGEPAMPASLRAPANNELYIVQFVATPLDEMRQDITSLGGVIEGFLPDEAHIVRMTGQVRDQVKNLPHVRWVGPVHVAYRLSEQVQQEVLAGDAAAMRYSVMTYRDGMEQQQAIADMVTAMGGVVDVVTPDMHRMEITVTPAQLLEIARRNEVSLIDPWLGPGGHDMDIIRQLGGAVPILSGVNFNGQGVRGEVFDGGCITGHQQWAGQAPIIRTTNANDSHGTACYGINFATGTGNAQATGLCWQREQGFISRYQDTTQFSGATTRLSLNTAAVNPLGTVRSCYQTSSVGSPQTPSYTTISQEVDSYLFQVDYLSCQSQSNLNSLSSRPQAWAKNILSVGGIDHKDTLSKPDDTSSGASFGPAADGRQKPELAHSYLQVFTTYTTSVTGYGQFSGTSSATPITAGHFGLLLQMWHEGVWTGHGGGSSVFDSRPKSTTAKAIMINNAYRYPVGQGGLTRNRLGWGMADVGAMYNIRNKTYIVNETDALLNTQSKSYQIQVGAGEPEFRATMVYSDPPPTGVASPNAVNDLNLKVTSPSGTVYWGNNGIRSQDGGANFNTVGGVANGPSNIKDTCENVFVQSPAAGVWTVEVIGASIVVDARVETAGVTDADYGLCVTGGTLVTPPPTCYANCDGVGGLTANDFACFLAAYNAGASYANCDGVGGLTANDFACFLAAYNNGCS